jgi:hypothetical protein
MESYHISRVARYSGRGFFGSGRNRIRPEGGPDSIRFVAREGGIGAGWAGFAMILPRKMLLEGGFGLSDVPQGDCWAR